MQTCDVVDDASKRQVWQAFENRQPTRVPVDLYTNPRVVLLNPQWNTEGWTFEAAATDPETHIRVLLQHELYRRQVINRYCDHPTELPEVWKVSLFLYNIYEAAILGCEVKYEDEQVHERTREILQSGIMKGGRFILREGNNLPPLVPEENLAAFYAAALEFGQYE